MMGRTNCVKTEPRTLQAGRAANAMSLEWVLRLGCVQGTEQEKGERDWKVGGPRSFRALFLVYASKFGFHPKCSGKPLAGCWQIHNVSGFLFVEDCCDCSEDHEL